MRWGSGHREHHRHQPAERGADRDEAVDRLARRAARSTSSTYWAGVVARADPCAYSLSPRPRISGQITRHSPAIRSRQRREIARVAGEPGQAQHRRPIRAARHNRGNEARSPSAALPEAIGKSAMRVPTRPCARPGLPAAARRPLSLDASRTAASSGYRPDPAHPVAGAVAGRPGARRPIFPQH